MDTCWPKAEWLITNPENPNKVQKCAYGKIPCGGEVNDEFFLNIISWLPFSFIGLLINIGRN